MLNMPLMIYKIYWIPRRWDSCMQYLVLAAIVDQFVQMFRLIFDNLRDLGHMRCDAAAGLHTPS